MGKILKSFKSRKAFTLVELVIVIAVIAVLSAILIPTFSGIIEKAAVAADQAEVQSYNVQLQLYLQELDETITMDNIRSELVERFFSEKLGTEEIAPSSAKYGYHYYYNFEKRQIELRSNDETFYREVQTVSSIVNEPVTVQNRAQMMLSQEGLFFNRENEPDTNIYGWNASLPETCFLQENFYLLDTAGSALAETVNRMHTVQTAADFAELVNMDLGKKDSAAEESLSTLLRETVIVTDNGNFATDKASTRVMFADDVTRITSLLTVVPVDGSVYDVLLGPDTPLATVAAGTHIVIPEHVTTVLTNGLWFATTDGSGAGSVTVVFQKSLADLFGGLDVGFTNAHFTFSDDSSRELVIDSTDSSQVNQVTETGEVPFPGGTLTEQLPVASFQIRLPIAGDGAVWSVALDAALDSYQFEAWGFQNEDGSSIVSDTTVIWSLQKAPAGVIIDANTGVLTSLRAGEIVVQATCRSGATATFTLRIGGVINTSRVDFVGENLTPVDGQTQKVTIGKGIGGSFGYTVVVGTNFPDIPVDTSFQLTSSAPNAQVQGDGTVQVSGAGDFTLTLSFDKYDIVKEYRFTVEEVVTVFDCIEPEWTNIGAYLYKVGNSNAFDITKLWQFTGKHVEYGLSEEEIEIHYSIINARDNLPLTDTGDFRYTMDGNMLQFAGVGVVRVVISAVRNGVVLNSITVPLEVKNGYNVTSYAELLANSTSNKMILNDIALEAYTSAYIVNGTTLYGNGFTLDGTHATRPESMRWESLLSVKDAVVDNVRVIGQVFPEITWYQGAYSGYTLSLGGAYCEFYNSYVYGSRAALYVNCDAYVKNCVLEGGILANAILDCQNITFEDVTTIQNIDSDAIAGGIDEKNLGVGLGLYIQPDFVNQITITLKGDLRQYNWVDTNLAEKVKDPIYKNALLALLEQSDEYKHKINGTDYVNAGIVFYGDVLDINAAIVDLRNNKTDLPYGGKKYEKAGFAGTIYSLLNKGDSTASGSYILSENRFDSNLFNQTKDSVHTKPEVSLDSSGVDAVWKPEISGNTLSIFLPEGGSFTIDASALPIVASFYGKDVKVLAVLVDENGDPVPSITVDASSPRQVTFRIKFTLSEHYDATGTWQDKPQTYYYDFVLVSKLPIRDAVIEAGTPSENTDFFYVDKKVSACETNYRTAVFLLNGLKITDYDPETGTYKTVDFSEYTELPQNLKIKSFKGGAMASADQYELKVYNGKLLIVSVGASPQKRSDDVLQVVLEYTGYNGQTVSITRTCQFSSGTNSVGL